MIPLNLSIHQRGSDPRKESLTKFGSYVLDEKGDEDLIFIKNIKECF